MRRQTAAGLRAVALNPLVGFLLDENPNKYLLRDDGLPLALGLALVRTAREALRKQRCVDEALSKILDPIAALDRTGDILLGAIVSAVLEQAPDEVVAPLVRSFVMLQNLDFTRYPEFRSFFGRDPAAFLKALEDTALAQGSAPNLSWLTEALKELRGNGALEAALARATHRWLNMYSLAPERMVLLPVTPQYAAERVEKRANREQQLSVAMASLSQQERDLLAGMVREERGDYSQLNLLAFQALAGHTLASFGESLRNWCFAASLNGGYHNHHEEFNDLLHFNLLDWAATKGALGYAAELLRQSGTSATGQWALVYVLRATGDSRDAQEANRIAEELTKDRQSFKGWRLIENYCATDPCDPASEAPENIDRTAEKYREINPAEIRGQMSYTQTDSFFTEAQPGLARFRPEAAIAALRAVADQAVSRTPTEFRNVVFLLDNHTLALEDRVAAAYIEKAREIAQAALDKGEDKNHEAWVAAQCALVVAFPHMAGDEQFDALINHPKDGTALLDLCALFQPVDENKVEQALDKAVREGDFVAQFRILCFAEYSRSPLSARTKELVLNLIESPHDHVRLSALSLIHSTADPVLLSAFVKSGWSAGSLDAVSHKVEIFHGSQALVQAAKQGMITAEACLARIGLFAYERLAEDSEAVLVIADRLNTAIRKAAEYQVGGNQPDIEQNADGRHCCVVLSVSERPTKDESPFASFERFAESGDAWYERQLRNQDAAERFERDLTKAGAQLVIQSVTVGLIAEIDKAAPALVDAWCTDFSNLDKSAFDNVHNIAVMIAGVVVRRDLTVGLKLFERLKTSVPPVRLTFGRDHIALDVVTAWSAANHTEMKALCFARLDRIGNDHDLGMEVLAAVSAGRLDVLRDYVMDRRHRIEPAHRARAAMVAGLSPDNAWATETIAMLKDEHGFLRRAYEGAKFAMERHQWSRHWAARMRTATEPVELWRYAILLSKIVDGRFEGVEVVGNTPSPLIKRYGTTINELIRGRFLKWKDKRVSKLFGMDAPDRAFLPGW